MTYVCLYIRSFFVTIIKINIWICYEKVLPDVSFIESVCVSIMYTRCSPNELNKEKYEIYILRY